MKRWGVVAACLLLGAGIGGASWHAVNEHRPGHANSQFIFTSTGVALMCDKPDVLVTLVSDEWPVRCMPVLAGAVGDCIQTNDEMLSCTAAAPSQSEQQRYQ